jgi:phospholipid transport system substrate-binding protein
MKKIILLLVAFFALTGVVGAADIELDMGNFFEGIATKFEKINKLQNEKSKKNGIKEVSIDILDLNWMGNFILGKNKKSLKKDDIDGFINLYSDYLIENYLKILLVINTNNYKIISVQKQREDAYIVDIVILYENVNTKNSFRIIKKGDKYLITDIITEGVSFVSAQRSDVNSRIDRVGFESFIKEIENKLKD